MFTEERRNKILELLKREGRVQVNQLAGMLAVTEDAIRKDLRFLESNDLLKRTYGGAVLPSKHSSFVPYQERGEPARKLPFAKAAASLIQPGETVFLEASSYTNLIFNEIGPIPDVTFVTNGIYGLPDLIQKVRVIHLGGEIHPKDESCYGSITLDSMASINFTKCFLRTSGITPDWMVTTSLRESLDLKKLAMKNSEQIILLVEESNWNQRDMYNVCSLHEVDLVVTNTADTSIINHMEKDEIPYIIT
ncbi:DeoR/GlpR family DNA-binding transcription regulator [Paenibacillus lutrae]|uniref:DeoR family transcriptional regulator n=1 Tax=Paenibacillus lutrae TaxID=2078573 RepID=A0A7X3FEL8_9BACL|nr:DeoR/GlpR family DNA-binding transcription regulator [Paenibacillus lutrae]MVO98083.1 DeoR family transcriptional regulator [Paenibacillus lutrae]